MSIAVHTRRTPQALDALRSAPVRGDLEVIDEGDSWSEWCEPSRSAEDQHLVIVVDDDEARPVSRHLSETTAQQIIQTTAQDWSVPVAAGSARTAA